MSDTPTPRDVLVCAIISASDDYWSVMAGEWPEHDKRPATEIAEVTFLSALTTAGYVVVPREPTEAMETACIRASLGYLALHALKSIWPWHNRRHVRGNIRACYRAMIAAATKESEG